MNNYVIFDLQLFATVVNATTSAASGNNLSAEMKTYYEKRLLDNAEPKLVHNQFGDKYPIPKGSGKTIEMRKYSPLAKATTALTEGVTPDGQALNVSTITATVRSSIKLQGSNEPSQLIFLPRRTLKMKKNDY